MQNAFARAGALPSADRLDLALRQFVVASHSRCRLRLMTCLRR